MWMESTAEAVVQNKSRRLSASPDVGERAGVGRGPLNATYARVLAYLERRRRAQKAPRSRAGGPREHHG